MAANPAVLRKLGDFLHARAGEMEDAPDAAVIPPTGGPGPVPPKKNPGFLDIQDARKISPTTGKPFKEMGGKTVNADPAILKAIIAHAKAKGLNPYDALAIAMQETEFGKRDPNWGRAYSYDPDKGIDPKDINNIEASRLTNALKEKVAYAAQLQKSGKIKPGESYALQAYNGYGDLRKNLMEVGGKKVPQNYYGVPVTGDTPMLMSQNPLYGKTVISLRDEILKKHPGVKQLVDTTPAYAAPGTAPIVVKQ